VGEMIVSIFFVPGLGPSHYYRPAFDRAQIGSLGG